MGLQDEKEGHEDISKAKRRRAGR